MNTLLETSDYGIFQMLCKDPVSPMELDSCSVPLLPASTAWLFRRLLPGSREPRTRTRHVHTHEPRRALSQLTVAARSLLRLQEARQLPQAHVRSKTETRFRADQCNCSLCAPLRMGAKSKPPPTTSRGRVLPRVLSTALLRGTQDGSLWNVPECSAARSVGPAAWRGS